MFRNNTPHFSVNWHRPLLGGLTTLLLLHSSVLAWLPGEDREPTVERAHGLFGNPALLGSFDGSGSLLWYGRDPNQGSHDLRVGLHGEENGLAFEWHRNDRTGLDLSRWSWTQGAAGFHRRFFLGIRTELLRTSLDDRNAWSWTPGVLWRTTPFLSLGYEAPQIWQLGPDQQSSHVLGTSLRFGDPITLGLSLQSERARDLFDKEVTSLLLHGEATLGGMQFYAQTELSQDEDPQWRLALALPLGARSHASYQWQTRHDAWSVGLSQRSAHNPNYLSPRRLVRLALDRPLVESDPGFSFFGPEVMTLESLRGQFQLLARDRGADPVIIDFTGYSGGLTAAMEIRRGIQLLRQSNKKVVAFAPEMGPGILLAASPANKVLLHPSGRMRFAGLASETLYYKGLLDWAGIQANMLRHGSHKSAVEPMTLDSMSAEAREDLTQLLGSLWSMLRDSVALSRGKTPAEIDSIASVPALSARAALRAGLVDDLVHYDDLAPWTWENLLNRSRPDARLSDWTPHNRGPWRRDWMPRGRIAVITIEGTIVDGQGGRGGFMGGNSTGSADVLAQLDAVEQEMEIDALILRIESPGGSALASDVIWHRLRRMAADGLPIVASLGNTAASGGYYVACAADRIVAEPGTVLGSIGIFGGKVNFEGLLSKLKVRPEIVKTHPSADATSTSRGFSPEEAAALQEYMDEFYGNFVRIVAEARNLDSLVVDSLGGGRIYTGMQALPLGLIDGLGGLGDAVLEARRLAKIPAHIPVELKPFSTSAPWIPSDFIEGVRLQALKKQWEGMQLWALWPLALGGNPSWEAMQ